MILQSLLASTNEGGLRTEPVIETSFVLASCFKVKPLAGSRSPTTALMSAWPPVTIRRRWIMWSMPRYSVGRHVLTRARGVAVARPFPAYTALHRAPHRVPPYKRPLQGRVPNVLHARLCAPALD